MNKKRFLIVLLVFLVSVHLFASEIKFGGGYTKVSLQDGNHSVSLTGSAYVNTENISLLADSIELFGDNYETIRCTGNVTVKEEKKGLTLLCPTLVYDRSDEELLADGWIEIDDTENEILLSCAWLDYDQKNDKMTLQIMAKIVKNTDNGIMTCTADSIEYDANAQTVVLKGSSKVVWGSDSYSASIITVNLETEEITLHGFISGEVNG